jgi:hypothetical protein
MPGRLVEPVEGAEWVWVAQIKIWSMGTPVARLMSLRYLLAVLLLHKSTEIIKTVSSASSETAMAVAIRGLRILLE